MSSATPEVPAANPPAKNSNKLLIGLGIGAAFCCLMIPVAIVLFPMFAVLFAGMAAGGSLSACKAKQAEAEATLKSLYVGERSYWAEYNFYTSDLKAIGFAPPADAKFVYGFAESGPGRSPGGDYDEKRQSSDKLGSEIAPHDSHGVSLTFRDLPNKTIVYDDRFVAGAAGKIGLIDEADLWVIDQTGTLTHVHDACASAGSSPPRDRD